MCSVENKFHYRNLAHRMRGELTRVVERRENGRPLSFIFTPYFPKTKTFNEEGEETITVSHEQTRPLLARPLRFPRLERTAPRAQPETNCLESRATAERSASGPLALPRRLWLVRAERARATALTPSRRHCAPPLLRSARRPIGRGTLSTRTAISATGFPRLRSRGRPARSSRGWRHSRKVRLRLLALLGTPQV